MAKKQHPRLPAEERKKLIMDEALKLFAKKGFEETKTREIAAAAGISEAAMFKYFKSKAELVEKSLEYKFMHNKKEEKAAIFASMDMEKSIPEDALRAMGLKTFEMIENNIDLIRVMIYSIMKQPEEMRKYLKLNVKKDERIFKKLTEKGIKSGTIKNLDSNIIGPIFPVMMIGIAMANYLVEGLVGKTKQREKLVETLVEVYLRGVLKA